MSKVSIVHVITGLGCGGAENMLYRLLKFHQAAGVSSSVLSLTDLGPVGRKIQELNIEVSCLGGTPGKLPGPKQIIRLFKSVKGIRPDVLQGWMYHGNLAATIAGTLRFQRVPVLWNIRQSLNTLRDERPLTRRVIQAGALASKLPCGIIYNSRAAAIQHEKIGYSKRRRVFIPNGFEPPTPQPPSMGKLPELQNLRPTALVVGHAARFHPKKGQHFLLSAIKMVRERGVDVSLVIAGRGMDEDNTIVTEMCDEQGLSGCTFLLGECSSMSSFYRSLDVFVSSSSWGEGFPNVIAEAMMEGIPCVGTDVGETRDIIGDTGVVVHPASPDLLADGICNLLLAPEATRKMLGARAADRIKTRFSMASVGRRYLSIYQDLYDRKSQKHEPNA
jgi:glycosyltransferase involved in cell wall biosynthesis